MGEKRKRAIKRQGETEIGIFTRGEKLTWMTEKRQK